MLETTMIMFKLTGRW